MSAETPSSGWLSVHAHYHEDRRRLLLEWLQPLARELFRQGSLRRFFFLRYPLGGPHVRWRLLPAAGTAPDEIFLRVEEAWSGFVSRLPSRSPADPAKVEAETRTLLAQDANEQDATIYPDNTLRRDELRPETGRYGGEDLLPSSLAFFCASSLSALSFLESHGSLPASRRLPQSLRWLLRQAWGFSERREELLHLLGYAARGWGALYPGLRERADQRFGESAELFRRLAAVELESLLEGTGSEGLARNARRLRDCLHGAEEPGRRRILDSHLHMTANRLELRTTDEVFLGRILERAVLDLESFAPRLWERLDSRPPLAALREDPRALLEQEVDRSLAAWAAG